MYGVCVCVKGVRNTKHAVSGVFFKRSEARDLGGGG